MMVVRKRVHRKQIENLPHRKIRGVHLRQHFRKSKRVCRQRPPGIGRHGGVKPDQVREPVEMRLKFIDKTRQPMMTRTSAPCMLLDPFEKRPDRPWPLRSSWSNPYRQKIRALSVENARRRFVGRVNQGQPELIAQHLKRRELPNEIRIDRDSIDQLQHIADVAKIGECVAETARRLQYVIEPDERG